MIALLESLSLPVAALGILACLAYAFHRRSRWIQAGLALSVLAFVLVSALLLVRLEKYGWSMPIAGGSRYFIGAWFIMVAYFVAAHRTRVPLLGALIMPLALILLLAGVVDDRTVAAAPLLISPPTWVHVVLLFGAMALLLLAAGAALVLMVKTRALKDRNAGALDADLPSVVTLQRLMITPFDLGFALITPGIMLAVLYAASAGLPHGWIWEPKIVWTLVNGGLYSLLFFVRHTQGLSRTALARAIVLLAACTVGAFLFTSHRDLLGQHGPAPVPPIETRTSVPPASL